MTTERTRLGRDVETALGEVLAHVRGETDLSCRIVDDPAAERILALRKRLRLSRQKFADRFGLDARALQDWEQGRRVPDRAGSCAADRHWPRSRGRRQGARHAGRRKPVNEFSGVGVRRARRTQSGREFMTYRRISVERLAPAVGAVISGVDLREPLEDETYAEIRRALLEHGVIFFRDQAIDHEQHLAFGRRFGELHIHPASPCVDGRPELMQVHTDANSTRQNGHQWHSDVSCDEEPPMGSVLHLHTVPECGGDTLFSSMYAAWDALSEPMKALLAPPRSQS